MGHIKHSITYYGLGEKWRDGVYSFEDLFTIAARLGGDGIELVPVQMVPAYPNPSDAWIDYFKGLCAEHKLTPVCYSVYIDNGMHTGRVMTEAERIAFTINDMEYAKRMGFSIVRSQHALMPQTLEKLVPYCEELGIHLAPELHGPHKPSTPVWQEYLELFERKNSDFIGVVMDFSSFISAPPATWLNTIPDDYCNKPLLQQARDLYEYTEKTEEEIRDFVRENGGTDHDLTVLRVKLFKHYDRTRPDYEGFRRLLKWSKYMHGKFYYVDETLQSKGIDYPGFMKIIKEENYQGFIASEYEGTGYDPSLSDEEQVARHIRMLEKLWEEA